MPLDTKPLDTKPLDTMHRNTMTTTAHALGATMLAALALSGCSGGEEVATDADPVSSEDGTLVVVAEDIDFPTDVYEAEAGLLDIRYENDGSIVHTLVIEDVDDFKLTVRGRGDVAEGSIDLAPGEYELYCDIPGHRGAGMYAALRVS